MRSAPFGDPPWAGDLPFKCALTAMPRGTWHWLDIYSGDCHGHIVRTEDPTKFPEDTPNRQDARASNMPNLFETEEERIIRLRRRSSTRG